MSNFRNAASVEDIKLPPTCHFDARIYDPDGNYAPVDVADCEIFLRELSNCGVPSEAASKVGRSEIPFQQKRDQCKNFAAAYDWAMRHATDKLLIEARTRAVTGREEAIYYQGEECGTVRKYSDTLLAMLLKNLHPEFKDTVDDGTSAGQIGTITIVGVPKGQRVNANVEIVNSEDGDTNE